MLGMDIRPEPVPEICHAQAVREAAIREIEPARTKTVSHAYAPDKPGDGKVKAPEKPSTEWWILHAKLDLVVHMCVLSLAPR